VIRKSNSTSKSANNIFFLFFKKVYC